MPFLLLFVAVTFAVAPFVATSFAGFDPSLFPVPQDDPPVQPAGYAFSIWGPIDLWMILSAGFGLWKRADDPGWRPMRPALFVSLGVGTFWLSVAERSPIGATVLIWVMQAAALVALWRTTRTDRWLQQAPVAIYAGWLTAASSVSIGLLLAGWGWMGATPAALVALAVALVLALGVQARLPRAPEYGLTVIWALVAVVVQNTGPLNAPVAGLAAMGVVLMAGLLVWRRLSTAP